MTGITEKAGGKVSRMIVQEGKTTYTIADGPRRAWRHQHRRGVIASVPVMLHGAQDKAVLFSHGQWLAAHISGVEAWLFDYEGHGTLRENQIGEVHAWLADRL